MEQGLTLSNLTRVMEKRGTILMVSSSARKASSSGVRLGCRVFGRAIFGLRFVRTQCSVRSRVVGLTAESLLGGPFFVTEMDITFCLDAFKTEICHVRFASVEIELPRVLHIHSLTSSNTCKEVCQPPLGSQPSASPGRSIVSEIKSAIRHPQQLQVL